ncbi:two-component regulator propeller domain-containing protein [Chloroflexota bacterium]
MNSRRDWKVILFTIVGIGIVLALLFTLKGGSGDKYATPGWAVTRPPYVVLTLAVQEDTLWAGGKDGVYKLDRQSGNLIEKLEGEHSFEYVKALLVDSSGALWIGHWDGLTRYDGVTWQTYTEKTGLPDNRVNALMEDREGQLWVGTWGGVAVLEEGEWRVINSADGLADDMVNVILQDREGGMWFGSYVAPDGGISYFKDGKWQLFSTSTGLPHNNITSLLEDSSGGVWAGTGLNERGGAARFGSTGTGWAIEEVITRDDGLAGEKVRSLFQDSDGVIWFGSEYDGVARVKKGQWSVLTDNDGLSHNEVMCMLQDAEGDLWLGTRDGITRITAAALVALR